MRDYARFAPTFWTGETGRKIRGQADLQIVLAYLITCPNSNMIGLYYLPLPIIAHETGMPAGAVAMALRKLREMEVAYYDDVNEIVYVPTMASWQIGETIPPSNKNLIKGVNRELERFEQHEFAKDFVSRYDAPFCLGRGFEGASKGLRSLPTEDSEGPRRGGETSSAPLRDQDQDQAQAQEQEQASAARAPAHSTNGAKVWTAWNWREAFGAAWTQKYGGVKYGEPGDQTALPKLADALDLLPEAERLGAQARAPEMFSEFLASTDPKTVQRRHPFAFFVQEWGGLRVPKQDGPRARSVEVGHVTAEAKSGKFAVGGRRF